MSGELEAAGALATAGLAAGAIEGREPGGSHGEACVNCGAALGGPYCSQCGQHGRPHRSLAHMVEEFLHGLVHFDTKAWRTLPMVAFRPGTLTRNYVYGQRVRYISPLALFLFTVFFMFFVFAFGGGPSLNVNDERGALSQATPDDLAEARAELAAAEAELERVRADGGADLDERLALMSVQMARDALAEREAELAAPDAPEGEADATPVAPETAAPASGDAAEGPPVRVGVFIDDEARGQSIATGQRRWQDELREAVENDQVVINLGNDYLNERARHTLLNPDLALYKVQQAVYKFSFLLVPISLPFLALLFLWKRGVTLYDHVVFILYSLSFMSLLFLAGSLLGRLPGGWGVSAVTLLLLVPPVHMFFQLKGAYALGWFSAIWRTIMLVFITQISLTIFVLVILIVGLAG